MIRRGKTKNSLVKKLLVLLLMLFTSIWLSGCLHRENVKDGPIKDTPVKVEPTKDEPIPGVPVNDEPTKDEPVFDALYVGYLILYYSNDLPPFFAETASVDVKISINNEIKFGTGTLKYYGKDIDQEKKFFRKGELNIRPKGAVINSYQIVVDENTHYHDKIELYVRQNSNWKRVINETQEGTWPGGLEFDMEKALTVGDVIEASTGTGTVRWSLKLYLLGA